MGTRALIGVVIDGDFRVAQYCGYDGSPKGQGVEVLRFARGTVASEARAALRACSWITDEEFEERKKYSSDMSKSYPELFPEMGSGVLYKALQERGLMLHDNRMFAGDSLMCEWAYVLDYDLNVMEAFVGFNTKKVGPRERFSSEVYRAAGEKTYHPVTLAWTGMMDKLPTDDDFLTIMYGEGVGETTITSPVRRRRRLDVIR